MKRANQDSSAVFLEMHKYLTLISFPILIGMSLVAHDALLLLVGAKWQEAVPVLRILCVVNILQVSAILLPAILEGRGNVNATLRYRMLSAALIPLGLVVGVQYGLLGMMWGWCAVIPCTYIYLLSKVLSELELKLSEFLANCVPAGLSTLLMSGAVMLTLNLMQDATGFERVIAGVAVGALSYVLVIKFLFPKDWSSIISFAVNLRS